MDADQDIVATEILATVASILGWLDLVDGPSTEPAIAAAVDERVQEYRHRQPLDEWHSARAMLEPPRAAAFLAPPVWRDHLFSSSSRVKKLVARLETWRCWPPILVEDQPTMDILFRAPDEDRSIYRSPPKFLRDLFDGMTLGQLWRADPDLTRRYGRLAANPYFDRCPSAWPASLGTLAPLAACEPPKTLRQDFDLLLSLDLDEARKLFRPPAPPALEDMDRHLFLCKSVFDFVLRLRYALIAAEDPDQVRLLLGLDAEDPKVYADRLARLEAVLPIHQDTDQTEPAEPGE